MKKFTLITLLITSFFFCNTFAQTTATANGNVLTEVVAPVTLESLIKTSTLTDKTFTSKAGNTYPVYISKNGKFFICRKSEKSGNYYKQYR